MRMSLNENMNVFEYYLDHCQKQEWYEKYYQCGADGHGSVFKFLSTNYRDLKSFVYYFEEFDKRYKDVPRSKWDRSEKTGEEVAKQYVVNLRQSSLFSCEKDGNDDTIYHITGRGEKFRLMLNSNFSDNEKKFLIFLFIVNSSFNYKSKYIIKQSKMLWDIWADYEIETQDLKRQIVDIVKKYDGKFFKEIFNYDVLWYLSFYSDDDFLMLYKNADKTVLKILHDTTINDYEKANKSNVLAYKIKGTNLSIKTIVDSLIMIYLSESILGVVDTECGFHEFYRRLIDDYDKMCHINKEKVFNFIIDNDDVFRVIYSDAISSDDDFIERYIPPYQSKIDLVEPIVTKKIDVTTVSGVQRLESVREVLKRIAKEEAHHRCLLEPLNNCRYFTSKEENENYLEIHHFVPREFSGDFDVTLEFVDNYIPLCPNCHRMIHHGTDETRKQMINYLYSIRGDALKAAGVDIDLKTLYKYYKIDE